jgi:putative transposase
MNKRFELLIHFIRLLMKLITPGGAKALVAENLALKQQLITLNRRRLRSPALTTFENHYHKKSLI